VGRSDDFGRGYEDIGSSVARLAESNTPEDAQNLAVLLSPAGAEGTSSDEALGCPAWIFDAMSVLIEISREAVMKSSTRLYAWLKFLTVLHIVEQLILGMQDLYALQRMISIYENWFANTAVAMTVLVTIIMALAVVGHAALSTAASHDSSRCLFSGSRRLVSCTM
jgi:hypothetical protein